jgi:mitochondrial FAD-linked sulfhydryl oxidase
MLYPCAHCRAEFQRSCEQAPPDVSTRTTFAHWVCERHNDVNRYLGKPLFPCDSLALLDERWRSGCSRHGEEEEAKAAIA